MTFLTLWRREMAGYFYSPIAYAVAVFFLASMGFIFWILAYLMSEGGGGLTIMNLLFASPFFWIVMLVVAPVLTMRLLAEEKRSGTIETLLTAPVTDAEIVLAKYAGVLTYYLLLWLPTVVYVVILRHFSATMAPVDFGPVLGGYLGALLVGVFYLAIGVFCSALTQNQVVAALAGFAAMLGVFLAGFLENLSPHPVTRAIGAYICSYNHMVELSRGVVDSRPVVFHLTAAALMLFAAVKVVEARRWK